MRNVDILSFEFVENYPSYSRKQDVVELLCRNADSFNPHLSVWYEGATLKEKMEGYVQPNDCLLLVKVNDHIVGMSHMSVNSVVKGFEHIRQNLRIETTTLDSVFRGKGLASILYEEVESLNEWEIRAPYIFRSTWETNDVQLYLYKKFGYTFLQESTYPHKTDLKRLLFGKAVSL